MKAVATGEVYMADLEPVVGSEQGRRRPVVVFQNPNVAQFSSTAIIVPLTTNQRLLGRVGTCSILRGEGGLAEDSVALGFQLRALDTRRFGRRMGALSQEAVEDVADPVLAALGIAIDPK